MNEGYLLETIKVRKNEGQGLCQVREKVWKETMCLSAGVSTSFSARSNSEVPKIL